MSVLRLTTDLSHERLHQFSWINIILSYWALPCNNAPITPRYDDTMHRYHLHHHHATVSHTSKHQEVGSPLSPSWPWLTTELSSSDRRSFISFQPTLALKSLPPKSNTELKASSYNSSSLSCVWQLSFLQSLRVEGWGILIQNLDFFHISLW